MIFLNRVPLDVYKQLKLKQKKESEFASKTIIGDSQGNIKLPSKFLNEISLKKSNQFKKGSFQTFIKLKSISPLIIECRLSEGGK